MKRTSVPEQAIFFYTKKYIDANARNNDVKIGCYTADVAFFCNGQKYIAEYDSYSQHYNKIDKDEKRDKVFIDAGYKIIRLRDKGLPFLTTSHCIRLIFDNYTPKMLDNANAGINEYLAFLGFKDKIDIRNDLEKIKAMYSNY